MKNKKEPDAAELFIQFSERAAKELNKQKLMIKKGEKKWQKSMASRSRISKVF